MLNDILKLLPLQGVTNKRALPQGVASLALGYVLLGFQPVLTKSENRYKLIFKTYLWVIRELSLFLNFLQLQACPTIQHMFIGEL